MAISIVGGASVQPYRSSYPRNCDGGWTSAEKPTTVRSDSIVWSTKPIVLSGQLLGLFAFSNANNPRFAWLSFRTLYFLCSVLAHATAASINILYGEKGSGPSSSVNFVNKYNGGAIYAGANVAYFFLLFRLSRYWNGIVTSFRRLEHDMAAYPKVKIGPYIRRGTFTVFVVTIVDFSYRLSIVSVMGVFFFFYFRYRISSHSKEFSYCIPVEIVIDAVPLVEEALEIKQHSEMGLFFQEFCYLSFPHLRHLQNNNPVLVLCCFWMKIQSKYAFGCNDLILWTVGAALAARLKSLNRRLHLYDFKTMTEEDWRCERETFNKIVKLTQELDRTLGPNIVLSFATGLWFGSGGILLLLDSELTMYRRTYILLSTSFWLARLALATLSMSTVCDQHQNIKNTLYLVPTGRFNNEVSRFEVQVCHDEVGLSGMRFFKVTRSVLLTLFGTIASYEIVLMQFN